jgi:hypothetical protein
MHSGQKQTPDSNRAIHYIARGVCILFMIASAVWLLSAWKSPKGITQPLIALLATIVLFAMLSIEH